MTAEAYRREVVAKRPGYYGSYRQEGERFVITAPEHFSDLWMVDADKAVKAGKPEPLEDPAVAELREALGIEGELHVLRQREAKLEAELDAALAASKLDSADEVAENAEDAKDAEEASDEQPAAATRRRRALAS